MAISSAGGPLQELEALVSRLEGLSAQPRVSEDYIRFRVALLRAQWAVRQALAGDAADRVEPAAPDPAHVAFEPGLLRSLFQAIVAATPAEGRTEDVARLRAAADADPILLEAVARAAAFGPDLETLESRARQLGVMVDALLFVGRAAAAPFVAEAVAARSGGGGQGRAGAEPHRCPACGSSPSIARLRRADGRRLLTCGLCGSEWEAARMACACCGTREPESLGILRLDDADPRWIETCEACKGYIKTVDERRLAEDETVFPVVEEAATLHLDLLAEREGYIRRVPYVLSG